MPAGHGAEAASSPAETPDPTAPAQPADAACCSPSSVGRRDRRRGDGLSRAGKLMRDTLSWRSCNAIRDGDVAEKLSRDSGWAAERRYRQERGREGRAYGLRHPAWSKPGPAGAVRLPGDYPARDGPFERWSKQDSLFAGAIIAAGS